MDDIALRSLLVARGLVERAQVAAADGTDPGAMAAVVLYDTAVETGSKAAMRGLPNAPRPQRGRDLSLPEVLDALVAASAGAGSQPSEVIEARRLHDARNGVQHDGEIPSADTVTRSYWRALDFLQWATATFFAEDFSRLSRTSLVKDDEVRQQLERAELHGRENEFDLGSDALAIAFELARSAFREGEQYQRRSFTPHDVNAAIAEIKQIELQPSRAVRPRTTGLPRLQRVIEGLSAKVAVIDDRVEALALGARVSDYVWFRRRFPGVVRTMDGAWHTYPMPEGVPSAEEFARGLEFVTTTALHWQQFPPPPAPLLEEPSPEGSGPESDGTAA